MNINKKVFWGLILFIVVLIGVVWFLLAREVSNEDLERELSETRTTLLSKSEAILAKLDTLVARETEAATKLENVLEGQRQTLLSIGASSATLNANAAKLDRLLSRVERELPDGMKAAE